MRKIGIALATLFVALPALSAIDVPLTLTERSGVARLAEPVRSGVPVPRSAGLLTTTTLRLLAPSGSPVPARFTVLGRWGSGPADPAAPIRWVLVDAVADAAANGASTYTLTDSGAGPSLGSISVVETASDVTLTTGPARFLVSKSNGSLLESVWLDLDGSGQFTASEQAVVPATDAGPFVDVGATEYRGASSTPLSVQVEDAGPGRATVRVEGFHTSAGNPLLRYVTRLTFYAGESFVDVEHTIVEGRVMGSGNGGYPGGIVETPLDRAGLRLRLATAGTVTAKVVGDAAAHSMALSGAATASVRQRPALDWQQPLAYQVLSGGSVLESGQRAHGAFLDLQDSRWGIAVGTRDFWRKGPERLSGAGDGTVTIELPSEPATIYQAMGLGERILLDFHPSSTPVASLQDRAQGFLKDPLFAAATPAWYVGSGALGDMRAAPSARYPQYEQSMTQSYADTMAWIDEGHAFGLINYLDMPIDRWDGTPSPDHVSWGNSYYDPAGTQIREFARTGDVKWLTDLAFPHLRHIYTTDCYDVDDATHWANGISGARGEVHRGAYTGEYHYLESLWDYYALTGDRRAFERGLAAARTYADSTNWDNDADWGSGPGLTTRIIAQKLNTLVEAYLATGDATLLAALKNDGEDFVAMWGTPEGFIRDQRQASNPYVDDQAFMATVLYLPALWKYHDLTASPAARQVLVTVPQRILNDHRLSQNPSDPDYLRFFNQVQVTAAGGGNYTALGITPAGNSDDYMYDQGVHGLVTALCRAAALSGNTALVDQARILYEGRVLPGFADSVWDKPQSQMTIRAAAALVCLDPAAGVTGDDFVEGQGHGPGNPNEVAVFTPAGSLVRRFYAYGASSYGVNAVTGDLDGGDPEIVTGPGPGDIFGPQGRAFRRDGMAVGKVNFYAYGTLKLGLNVATALLDSDAFREILTGPGPGVVFGPHVRGFNYDGIRLTAISKVSYFAYGTLRYGVNVTSGDVEGDGFGEIVTAPGPGVIFGPQVRGFDYDATSVRPMSKINFNAFSVPQMGATVAGAAIDPDAYTEIFCAPGPSPALSAQVRGFDYDGLSITGCRGCDVTPFTTAYGARIGGANVDGTGAEDLIAGAGPDPSADSTVLAYAYNGAVLAPLPVSFVAFPGSSFGVNVSGGALGY